MITHVQSAVSTIQGEMKGDTEPVGISSSAAVKGCGVYHLLDEEETTSHCGHLDETNPFSSKIYTTVDRSEAEALGYSVCELCHRQCE